MTRFAADENITRQLVVGLRRGLPSIDLITVHEAGLSGADDTLPLAVVIEDLVLVAQLGLDDDWTDGVHYLPLT